MLPWQVQKLYHFRRLILKANSYQMKAGAKTKTSKNIKTSKKFFAFSFAFAQCERSFSDGEIATEL